MQRKDVESLIDVYKRQVFVCPSSLLQYLLFVLLHTPLERCILPELVLGKSPELRLLVVTLRGRDILQHLSLIHI